MSWGWNDRPAKAEVKHLLGGDKPAVVYKVGHYEVTVPGDKIEITYRNPYHRQTDPRSTFPNMDVTGGEIRIPVTDLVDEILSRIDPVELAQSLWQNDKVKGEFMSCLTTRWNEQGITDADRRKFLADVKETVHDTAIDALASTMMKLEFEMNRRANHSHQISRINEMLRELDVRVSRAVKNDDGEWVTQPVLLQFDQLDRPTKNDEGGFTRGELEIGGKAWEEARAYWRDEVAKRFPAPTDDEDPDGRPSDLGLSDTDLEVRP